MQIVAFSMTPLFADRVMGGAQKQLKAVALHLGTLGHTVTILCSRREPDALTPFNWHPNVSIHPILRFKQPFPEPYATPIYNIANAMQDIGAYLAKADVFYSHDGGFIFPYVYQNVPTVVSLRSVIFSETLQSAFLFQGDDLILISHHQRDTLLDTVGRFFPDLADRTHVIYNGLDFTTFKPTDPQPALDLIPEVDPDQHALVLFPHRPEAPKGILEVIETARLLVHQYGIAHLRVLVPRWIESALSPDDRAFYVQLTGQIANYDLTEHFVFHEWMPQSLMPAYYSMGAVTLAVGSYVETFGNVPYESLACGTPAVVARVGPARELLPEHLIDKVDFGDVAGTAAVVARIIQRDTGTSPDTTDYLRRHFHVNDMIARYAEVILNARKREALPYVHVPITAGTRFRMPAWVYTPDDQRCYHDFRAEWRTLPDLDTLTTDEKLALYRDGYLVPQQEH